MVCCHRLNRSAGFSWNVEFHVFLVGVGPGLSVEAHRAVILTLDYDGQKRKGKYRNVKTNR